MSAVVLCTSGLLVLAQALTKAQQTEQEICQFLSRKQVGGWAWQIQGCWLLLGREETMNRRFALFLSRYKYDRIMLLTESAHWADSVSKSRCPSVCRVCVCTNYIFFHVLLLPFTNVKSPIGQF